MPPAAGCPTPATPPAAEPAPAPAGPAPAPAAGAPPASADAKASLTARARDRVQACGRSPSADVLTSAQLHTSCAPHRPRTVDATDRLGVLRRRQRDALAQWRPATKESPIKRSFRHHRPLLEVAPNQALASPPLQLLHHADLGYQVCGN
jgi:hypothetical protein